MLNGLTVHLPRQARGPRHRGRPAAEPVRSHDPGDQVNRPDPIRRDPPRATTFRDRERRDARLVPFPTSRKADDDYPGSGGSQT
jgi:hypothetical protein